LLTVVVLVWDQPIPVISITLNMSINLCAFVNVVLLTGALLRAHAENVQSEACDIPNAQDPVGSQALLQIVTNNAKKEILPELNGLQAAGQRSFAEHKQESQSCSYDLQGDEDGSKVCASLIGRKYTSGADATLDEAGYAATAALCCHHEMSLFVRRELANQGLGVCSLPDLHGFVHWYDCSSDKTRTDVRRAGDDLKTYAQMQAEIAAVSSGMCPWLVNLGDDCPVPAKDCLGFPPCRHGADIPAGSLAGEDAPLTEAGYAGVALRCCHIDMEKFVRRELGRQGFKVCNEGSFEGFIHWYDCSDDGQTYESLKEGLVMGRSGLPPLCPWLGSVGDTCPPTGHNCPRVEVPEPEAHRRRTACR